jgi:hypothetical protein
VIKVGRANNQSLAQGCNREKKEMIGSRQQGKGTAKMKGERQNRHISGGM